MFFVAARKITQLYRGERIIDSIAAGSGKE